MNLSEKQNAALDAIRPKIEKQDVKWSKDELDNLELVYVALINFSTGKDVVLDRTCSACINRASKIVYNYIKYHERQEKFKPAKAVITEPGTQFVGTMGSGKFDGRVAKLNAIGFSINDQKSTFEKSEEVNDLNLNVSFPVLKVHSMTDEEFEALLLQLEPGEHNSKNDGLSSDEIVLRIEQLFILGFEYQDEAYRSTVTGTEIKIDLIKSLDEEGWNSFIDGEEVLKQNKAEQAALPPVIQPADPKTDQQKAPAKPEGKTALDWDKEKQQIVIIQEGKEPVLFDGDISKLDYNKVLWPLARKKGFTGSKPPKAELVEYLS